jgi:hypothetical protein
MLTLLPAACIAPSGSPPPSGSDTATTDSSDLGATDSTVGDSGTPDSADSGTAAAGLEIRLTWPEDADLDLHVMDEAESLFTTHDCNFCNASPDWGSAGTADDPSLELDSMGAGLETTSIASPATDTYFVAVHFFDERADATADATVEIYAAGILVSTSTRTLAPDEVWTVGSVSYPDLTVTLDTDPAAMATARTCE